MLKKLLLAGVVLALTVPLGAQTYVANLKLAVGASAVGFKDASSPTCTANSCLLQQDGHAQAAYASCVTTAASGEIVYRIDGTTATGTVGMTVSPGATFVIQGNNNLINFSAIRTGSTSGDVRCVLSGS